MCSPKAHSTLVSQKRGKEGFTIEGPTQSKQAHLLLRCRNVLAQIEANRELFGEY
jgi:hypothetical protein